MNFVAFDFETANSKRNSACSLALSVVRNNQIVDEFYSLINPQSAFSTYNTRIHGIHQEDTIDAPTFAELWPHISTFFSPEKIVVAHNATFDCSVLAKTLEHYNLDIPTFAVLDTLKTSRYFFNNFPNQKLNTICSELQIPLQHHHNALDDATACANILLYQIQNFGANNLKSFVTAYPTK